MGMIHDVQCHEFGNIYGGDGIQNPNPVEHKVFSDQGDSQHEFGNEEKLTQHQI
jgi:hypothetical protein